MRLSDSDRVTKERQSRQDMSWFGARVDIPLQATSIFLGMDESDAEENPSAPRRCAAARKRRSSQGRAREPQAQAERKSDARHCQKGARFSPSWGRLLIIDPEADLHAYVARVCGSSGDAALSRLSAIYTIRVSPDDFPAGVCSSDGSASNGRERDSAGHQCGEESRLPTVPFSPHVHCISVLVTPAKAPLMRTSPEGGFSFRSLATFVGSLRQMFTDGAGGDGSLRSGSRSLTYHMRAATAGARSPEEYAAGFCAALPPPGGRVACRMLELMRQRWEEDAAAERERTGAPFFPFQQGSVISSIFVVNCHRIVALRFELSSA